MAGQIDRLCGSDSTLEIAAFGATLVTGSAVEGAWYNIILKTGDTVFPAGYLAGDLIQGTATMTFSATNSAALATFTTAYDITSWEVTFTKDSIDVTTLADKVKKYRMGKSDAQGTMNGINFITELRKQGGMANRFLRVVDGDTASNAVAVLYPVAGSTFYFRGMLNNDTTIGETTVFIFGKIEVGGWKAGAAITDAQAWDSSFTFTGNDPILYVMDNETVV